MKKVCLPKRMQTVLLLLGLFLSGLAYGNNEAPYTNLLLGDSIKTGKSLIVQDTIFFNPSLRPTVLRTNMVSNVISLKIGNSSLQALPDSFKVDVTVRIIYIDKNDIQDSIVSKTLSVDYYKNRGYKSKDIFILSDAYSVEVKVLDVVVTHAPDSTVMHALELENRLQIDRDYIMNPVSGSTMNCTTNAVQTIDKDINFITTDGELKVFWPGNMAVEKYDLEWTYIDSSALANGRYNVGGNLSAQLIFKNNATRISTTANEYNIPLLYDGSGTLFFRVRGTQEDNNGEIITTAWSSNYTNGLGQYEYKGHERRLNWQASTTFAEEAKRKSVVQYFDGGLRNRQTVTKDNTSGTAVVAETLYDQQGRPMIQVLPAPTLSKLIAYNPLFNVADINSREYDKGIYDTLTSLADYCADGAPAMNTVSGTALYYSASNPQKNLAFNQYIPESNGYVFTETRYAQDNTGRINMQSGVGATHQIGSGRETKYYYGTPEQTDLDALFGTEAGEASHYQKNMVRDANGQYSVSYVDMHGRTVATALAGDSIQGITRLSSYRDSIQTEYLLNNTNNIVSGNSITASKGLLVTKAGNHTFNYNLAADSLSLEDCKEQNICYDCLYDLEITITDDCNNQLLGGAPVVIRKSNFKMYEIDTTCNMVVPVDTSFVRWLEPGSYNITKKLTISEYGMQYYRDSLFLPHNTCKTYEDFLEEQKAIVRAEMNCESEPESIQYEYQSYRREMEMDMYPLVGQYASNEADRNCYSIFNQVENSYRKSTLNYVDEEGQPALVMNRAGQLVKPQALTVEEFIENFQRSWAKALIQLHPEYKLLEAYEAYATSLQWDKDFTETETYEEAIAKGYLNPTGNTTTAPASGFPNVTPDPLFSGYAISNTAKTAIQASLFTYKNISSPNTNLSLWGFATGLAKCEGNGLDTLDRSCIIEWNSTGKPFNNSLLCTGELDMAWKMFRSQYQTIKHNWLINYIKSSNTNVILHADCFRHFNTANELLTNAGFTQTSTDKAKVEAELLQTYEDNCKAYATRWWTQLQQGCHTYTTADSAIVINYLVNVCKEGSDAERPLGSSTVKPGSTYRFKSFEEVIQFYNDSTGRVTDINCNGLLLDKPLPYEQSVLVVEKVIVQKPEACECEKVEEYYQKYVPRRNEYSNFSAFMAQVYQVKIAQPALDSLRSLCSGEISCNYISKPLPLPVVFQCGSVSEACVECDVVKNLYDSFSVKFPTVVPRMEETDTTQQKINQVFATYLNHRLGFSKTTQEYLQFIQDCDNVAATANCTDTSLTRILYEYNKLFEGVPIDKLKNNIITLPQGKNAANQNLPFGASDPHYQFSRDRQSWQDAVVKNHPWHSGNPVDPYWIGTEELGETGTVFFRTKIFVTPTALNQVYNYIGVDDYIKTIYVNGVKIAEHGTAAPVINDGINHLSGLKPGWNDIEWELVNNVGYLAFNTSFSSGAVAIFDCEGAFTSYFNQQKGTTYQYNQLDSLYYNSCAEPLQEKLICFNNPVCDSFTVLIESFKEIRKPLAQGKILQNKQITHCAEEVVKGLNALIETRLNPLNPQLSGTFCYDPSSYTNLALLHTVKRRSAFATDSTYSVCLPLSLDCSQEGIKPLVPTLMNNEVLASDFCDPSIDTSYLSKKYHSVSMSDKWGGGHILWAQQYSPEFGSDLTPHHKYLPPPPGVQENHSEVVWIMKVPDSVQTYEQYVANRLSFPLVGLGELKSIKDLRFDTRFLPANYEQTNDIRTAAFLQATVEYRDGSTGLVHLRNNYEGSIYLQFKHIIDTTLYQSDCREAFTHYYNQEHGTAYTFGQLDTLYRSSCGKSLAGQLGCAPEENCDSLQLLVDRFKEIRKSVTAGKVLGNKRITDCTEEVIKGLNAILEVRQNFASPQFSDSFCKDTNPLWEPTKLHGVKMSNYPGDSLYHVILPLSLGCSQLNMTPEHRADLQENEVLPSDFCTTNIDTSYLSKKYYAVTMRDIVDGVRLMWSYQNSSAYAYYGASSPIHKYIPPVTASYNNDIFNFHLTKVPATVTNYAQYMSQRGSFGVVYLAELKSIRDLRFDTKLMPANYSAETDLLNPSLLQVTAEYKNGTVDTLHFSAWYENNYFLKYKETVDTALYQSDCKSAFVYYYNQQRGTTFTFGQLDTLYRSSCGKSLAGQLGCAPEENCDSLQLLVDQFKEIRKAVTAGKVLGNKRITDCAEEVVKGFNAILEVRQDPVNPQFSNDFCKVTTPLWEPTPFHGVKKTDYPGDSIYHAILPLSLGCSQLHMTPEYKDDLLANEVLPADFCNSNIDASYLSKKYYGATLRDVVNGVRVVWSHKGSTDYAYYGISSPLQKYLPVVNMLYDNHVLDIRLLKVPGTITDYTTYMANRGSFPVVYMNDLKSIKDLRFDSRLLPSNYSAVTDTLNIGLLQVTAEFKNGTVDTLHLLAWNEGDHFLKYKQVIDTALYQSDCKSAFVYYYNQQRGTAYTYQQIDSLYLLGCGKPLAAQLGCEPVEDCNSLQELMDEFKEIRKPVEEGKVFETMKTTYCADELLRGINALIEARSTAPNPKISGDFCYDTNAASIPTPLHGVKKSTISANDSAYHVALPLSLDCSQVGVNIPELLANEVTASDFCTPYIDPLYLNKKYYAVTLADNKGWLEIIWSNKNYYGIYRDRGYSMPALKYLPSTPVNENHSEVVFLLKVPETIQTYQQYMDNRASFPIVWYDSIKSIRDLRFDTRFIPENPALYNNSHFSASFLQATVEYIDGRIDSVHFRNNYEGSIYLKFKEFADTALYQSDCKKAFTYYYNLRRGTSYTVSQVDSIYAGSCGGYFNPCSNRPAAPAPLLLCGKKAANESYVFDQGDPCADSTNIAIVRATEMYRLYTDSLKNAFAEAYQQKCLEAANREVFTVTHPVSEYHYTLYYYDQAGNLVKTIPPEGVHPNRDLGWLNDVKVKRAAGLRKVPTHTLATTYRYNSLNQVVSQKSPDGGYSEFWYDRLGRLVVSRNAKQLAEGKYSYTQYDFLGRITEVGQKQQTTAMTQAIARDPVALNDWLRYYYTAGGKTCVAEQVTATFYDNPVNSGVLAIPIPIRQKRYTLRNRVSYTRVYDYLPYSLRGVGSPVYSEYDQATVYCYDIHGNVDTLQQDYRTGIMAANGDNRFKVMTYKYDLISGKVNQVHYQPGQRDQLYHRYEYDAENRITDVYTSNHKLMIGNTHLEDHEAFYQYYKHGPLARTVLGQEQVQGIDYAYTLQGWLKGVNSDTLLDSDANALVDGGANRYVGRDAFRFSLNYYNGEYQPIGAAVQGVFPGHSAYMGTEYRPLYNGNISSMVVGIPKLGDTKLYNYQYDQLNRLVKMDMWQGYNVSNGWSGITKTNDYKEEISYDGNGNILTYLRNGNPSAGKPVVMDQLTYQYNKDVNQRLANNKLRHVQDAIGSSSYLTDIDNQPDDNYSYDVIGNLTADIAENITDISWNVYGKIVKITKTQTANNNVETIRYGYDVAGNRVSKWVKKFGETSGKYTQYVRDASGNVMAIYTGNGPEETPAPGLKLTEHHLYGSSRIGIWNKDVDMTITEAPGSTLSLNFERGNKFFELSNHLGNVLAVISDKKLAVDSNSDGTVDYYKADVVNAADYAPFGMQLPGRVFPGPVAPEETPTGATIPYAGTLNGYNEATSRAIAAAHNNFTIELWVNPATTHEIDPESPTGLAGVGGQKYVIDALSGSAIDLSTDAAGVGISVGTNGVSVYEHAASYMPCLLSWEGAVNGWTHIAVVYNDKTPYLYVNGVLVKTGLTSWKTDVYASNMVGSGYYGVMNGQFDEVRVWGRVRTQAEIMANMNSTVSAPQTDLAAYWPVNDGESTGLTDISGNGYDVVLNTAYSSGNFTPSTAMPLVDQGGYRYGFNGKEMDNEVSGQGNQYDYGFRIYNPRLGRFLSVDPLAVNFPYYTPYQFSSNNPIVFIDLDGKEATLPENEQTIYTAPKFNIRDPDLTFIPGVLQAHRQPNVFTMQGTTRDIASEILQLKTAGYKIKGLIADSHGEEGQSVQIGETKYSLNPEKGVSPANDPYLKELGQYISGDIVLLGCQVGTNINLMTEISKATGRSVIASEGWNANWPGMFNDPGILADPTFNSLLRNAVENNWETILQHSSESDRRNFTLAVLAYTFLSGKPENAKEFGTLVLMGGVKEEMRLMMVEGISPSGTAPIYEDYNPGNGSVVHSKVGIWKRFNSDGSQEALKGTLILNPDGSYKMSDKPFYETKFGKLYSELFKARYGRSTSTTSEE